MKHLRVSNELDIILHQVAANNKISVADIIHSTELRVWRKRAEVRLMSDLSLFVTLTCGLTGEKESHVISPYLYGSGKIVLCWRSRFITQMGLSNDNFRAVLTAVCFSTTLAQANIKPYTPPTTNQPYVVVEEL